MRHQVRERIRPPDALHRLDLPWLEQVEAIDLVVFDWLVSYRVGAVDEATSTLKLLQCKLDTVVYDLLQVLVIILNSVGVKVLPPLHKSNCVLLLALLHELFDRLLLNFNRCHSDKLAQIKHLLVIIFSRKHKKSE